MYFYSSESNSNPILMQCGSFNKLLNYIIDGGDPFKVIKCEVAADKKLKIYWDTSIDCPWSINETIVLKNSSFNGSYFIESINNADKYLIAYNSTITMIMPTESNDTATASIIPCGIQRVLGGVSDNRTVFQLKSGMQVRIDDRDVYNVTGTPNRPSNLINTFRVCSSKNFDTLDFSSNKIIPPSDNSFTPTLSNMGKICIPYNMGYSGNGYDYGLNYSSNPSYTKMKYEIYANEHSIFCKFGETVSYIFISEIENGIFIDASHSALNCIYYNNTGYSVAYYPKYNSNSYNYCAIPFRTDRSSYSVGSTYSSYIGSILNDKINISSPSYYPLGLSNDNRSGYGFNYPDKNTNSLYFSNIAITESNNVTGYLTDDYKWCSSSLLKNDIAGTLDYIGNDLYKFVLIGISPSIDSYYHNSLIAIKLDRS